MWRIAGVSAVRAALAALLALAIIGGGAGPSHKTATAAPTTYDFSEVTALVQDAVNTTPLTGASLLLFNDGQPIYEQYFGAYNANTVVYIASATKWVSASVFMTLVDDGIVGLDDPVSMYLPAWTGQMGTITMRQLWSHTSGLPGSHACFSDITITLDACVEQIRQGGLLVPPGTQFYYGGASMQVAARVSEVATGRPWWQLFWERIKTPLGLTAATYGWTNNPQIGGGITATLGDYARLLQMQQALGAFTGQQVISPGSVIEMQKDQTFGVPIAYSPHPDARRYGLGLWRDIVNAGGAAVQVSSQGKFGFSPWVDNQRGYFGIFLVQDELANVYLRVGQIQSLVRGIIDSYDNDADGLADSIDTDDDADGYSDTAEGHEPLCGNGLNDDPADDGIVDDGCPAGPSQAGSYAEGSLRIGTFSGDPCGTDAWPADFVSGGIPNSTNRVTITDLTSFLAPIRHFNTSPPEPEYAGRWDLVPGAGLFTKVINISDLTSIIAVAPPMLGGVRAFNGPTCLWPP